MSFPFQYVDIFQSAQKVLNLMCQNFQVGGREGGMLVYKKRVQIDLKKVEGFIYQQLLNPL